MPYRNPGVDEAARQTRTIVHLETAQRIATMGSWQTDLDDDTRMYWSWETRKMAGWGPDEPEPNFESFIEMLHAEDRERFLAMRDDALAGVGTYAVDCRFFRRDGEMRHIHLEAAFERDDSGRPLRVIGVVRDVTEILLLFAQLTEAETARRDLLHRLIHSTEHERARLAHVLHDGPIQQLTATALRLEHLANGDGPEELVAVVDQVHDVIDTLRSTMFELRPIPFGGVDLGATLETLARAAVPDLDVSVLADGVQDPVADDVASATVRITQEALSNVREHAGATLVEIGLRSLDGVVDLEICDNGRGFDAGALPRPGHLGLVAMRERAEAVGGTFTVESQPTRTVVQARLPSSDQG